MKGKSKDRLNTFHQDDPQVTVEELWSSWTTSEVHNWTVAQVVEWLIEHVELPQYADTFRRLSIDGSLLPRCECFSCRNIQPSPAKDGDLSIFLKQVCIKYTGIPDDCAGSSRSDSQAEIIAQGHGCCAVWIAQEWVVVLQCFFISVDDAEKQSFYIAGFFWGAQRIRSERTSTGFFSRPSESLRVACGLPMHSDGNMTCKCGRFRRIWKIFGSWNSNCRVYKRSKGNFDDHLVPLGNLINSVLWLVRWLIDWMIDRFVDWLIDRFVDWLIDRLIDRLIDWLASMIFSILDHSADFLASKSGWSVILMYSVFFNNSVCFCSGSANRKQAMGRMEKNP